ncbi:hypothetical protein SmJEL517_g05035 [Synchytrium microbalum]|uniref:NADH dehydrogenase [ubiquinone] iron-sulfur protein 5 n=1 Tax=Synchytrium microbalum TaxID=1806994 RepID=A0A507C0Z7_9FUNG|nr:uncharacterized protein SmJEL517_g05035 [Synchytrium microbalum]TPX31656.1 hypothetical protein SmJEL517_g05035 [Synchytrium microbalum]
MSSGFGTNGGRGRCFSFFQEFAKCYVGAIDPKGECQWAFEDYRECLYHRKELLRLSLVQEEYEKKHSPKKDGGILASLGLKA